MSLDSYTNSDSAVGNLMLHNEKQSEPLCLLSICEKQQPPQEQNNLERRINGLIENLGSDEFSTREAAHRDLLAMDRTVLPLLARGFQNTDCPETRSRLHTIYRELSGSDRIRIHGNIGRDGVDRLREISDNMSITYADRSAIPGTNNPVDYISYERAGGWMVLRNQDGTYNIFQSGQQENPMETGVRISLDQQTGILRAVLQDGSVMIIPPAGPRWWYREGDKPLIPPNDN